MFQWSFAEMHGLWPMVLLCRVCDDNTFIPADSVMTEKHGWVIHFHPIAPTQSVDNQGAIIKQGLYFLFDFSQNMDTCIHGLSTPQSSSQVWCVVLCEPECCPQCHRHEGFDIHPSASTRIIVTLTYQSLQRQGEKDIGIPPPVRLLITLFSGKEP